MLSISEIPDKWELQLSKIDFFGLVNFRNRFPRSFWVFYLAERIPTFEGLTWILLGFTGFYWVLNFLKANR